MNSAFEQPDRVMVGVRGEVGNRLFLLQARQGRRLAVLKCEKLQLSALAQWLSQVVETMGRPGHLPDDFTLEAEYEYDFAVGEIAVALDEEANTIEVTFDSPVQNVAWPRPAPPAHACKQCIHAAGGDVPIYIM